MARDRYHTIVKEALESEGWTVTHDPYTLVEWNPDWEIDLGAERILAAQKGIEKIAVEIKSFEAESFAYEFHRALGQYLNYLLGLETFDQNRILFLAVPNTVYETEFQRKGIQASIKHYQVKILIYNVEFKKIEKWIPQPIK